MERADMELNRMLGANTGSGCGQESAGRASGAEAAPSWIRFTFKDDRIVSERFFFDLSSLRALSGISTDAVRRRIFGEPATAGVAGT
jgi:hypothetical protein